MHPQPLTEIPPWLARLPKDACVGTPELSRLFGVCGTTIHNWVTSGKLPPPDWHSPGHRGRGNKSGILKWHARTIRNFIRKQSAVKNGTELETSSSQQGA